MIVIASRVVMAVNAGAVWKLEHSEILLFPLAHSTLCSNWYFAYTQDSICRSLRIKKPVVKSLL